MHERVGQWNVKTTIGTHGYIYTTDERIPIIPLVTKRVDPNHMIRDKVEFLKWARTVVAEGERRSLPYSVIEACLFPWQR